MTEPAQLNDAEKKFVELWDGDIDSTAAKAGVSCREAQKFLRNVLVCDAIRNRELTENKTRQKLNIADRQELQKFWSDIMRDQLTKEDGIKVVVDFDTRVKASELLAKSDGVLSERRVHTGENGGPIVTANVHVDAKDLKDRARALVARRVTERLIFLQ